MSARRSTSRTVPRSLLAFSALHLLAALFILWVLVEMRCVEPCPPEVVCYDGCTLAYDP
jgi:hypothetical protein